MDDAPTTRYELSGLHGEIEILIDAHGVPHIYAEHSEDIYFGQGFNAARDRLFQIDLGRRRGLGLLSEAFGSAQLERDRASRLFRFRGDLDQEWSSYGPDIRSICTAFTAGINAYIDLTEEHPELLPPEFETLGYLPARWEPDDVVRIRHGGVATNVTEEVLRAVTLRDLGVEFEDLRAYREPFGPLTVPEGLDLDAITKDVLRDYGLVLSPPVFGAGDLPARGLDGSNNWVLSGSRTASGRPLLCNDPHRDTTSLPGMRYITHLCCPEFDAIGAGEPHLPGVSIGHNGTIAFGFTIFMIDQEDLYVYELNPDNPLEYRYQDEWRPMTLEVETIPVRGEQDSKVELLFSQHGPIVHIDPEHNIAFAVRAGWLEAGMVPYLGSIGYMLARNWDEFLAALDNWGAPGENLIYADIEGNIGWKPAGRVPHRPNWDGTLPVPGDGRYEWDSTHPVRDLPAEFNPSRGWISTANQFPLPDGHALADKVSYFWAPPERKQRIDEILAEVTDATVESMFDMQYDTVSIPARRVVDAVRELPIESTDSVPGLADLLNWDYRIDADSRTAAIYEVWFRRHFRPAVLHQLVRVLGRDDVHEVVARLDEGVFLVDDRVVLEAIEDPGSRLGEDPTGFLAHAVVDTLRSAWDDLSQLLGEDDSSWTWGGIHVSRSDHALKSALADQPDVVLTTGNRPRSGSGQTIQLAAYDGSFRQTMGSTFRMVLDVGEWDNSLAMNAPGQSGDWRSDHYTDLFEPWVDGESFPLLYSRKRVEQATRERIVLKPRG